jgi:hypothetical protein
MAMRWDDLFGDLEAQWDAEARRELDAEVADRTRRERAGIGLLDRVAAAEERELTLSLVDRTRLAGRVVDVGDGWLLLERSAVLGAPGGPVLVPLSAVTGVVGLGQRADQARRGRRFGFGYALRGLSRDRAVVTVADVSGLSCTGTIDAVGKDYLEVSEHAPDVPRRPENVTGRRVVPVAGVVLVRPA